MADETGTTNERESATGGPESAGGQTSAPVLRTLPEERPPDLALPDQFVDGKPNVRYIQARMRNLNTHAQWHQARHGVLIKGYESTLRGIMREAKMMGLDDESAYVDSGQKLQAFVNEMLDSPGVAKALEVDDEVLVRLSKEIEASIQGCSEWIEKYRGEVNEEADKYRARAASGKAWLARIEKILRAREDSRTAMPPHRSRKDKYALEASLLLRRMLYIMRSDLSDEDGRRREGSAAETILEIPRHVCEAAVVLWMAQNGIKFYAEGTDAEIRAKPSLFQPGGGAKRNCYSCDGLLWRCPPRHMKTTLGTAWLTSELIDNQRLQCFELHAVDDRAETNYNMVRNNFLTTAHDQAAGRRLHALFPKIKVSKSLTSETRFVVAERTKDPQIAWGGVRSARLGANVDRLRIDDPVKREEATQETTRDFTHKQITQQFLPRIQGSRGFTFATFTSWNDDDAMGRLIREAEAGRINFAVLTQAAGGPKSSPAFKPLWPSRYPARWLAQTYAKMQDPYGYACQFMAQTQIDDMRLVKRLGLYLSRVDSDAVGRFVDCRSKGQNPAGDCNSCHGCQMRQHARFVAEAKMHLSLDPAATAKKDKKRHTDKAGLVWAAESDVVLEQRRGSEIIESRETKLRFLEAKEFYASGSEAKDQVRIYAAAHRVDVVHIEGVGFSNMIGEDLRAEFGFTSSQVIIHSPKNQTKGQRLQAVAPCLEDCLRDVGLRGASVEFPGVLRADGTITIDDAWKWVEKQIKDFGSTGEDHVLDAITQLAKHLAHKLTPGTGAITTAVRDAEDEEDPMRSRMRAEYAEEEEKDVYAEEVRFIAVGHGRWK